MRNTHSSEAISGNNKLATGLAIVSIVRKSHMISLWKSKIMPFAFVSRLVFHTRLLPCVLPRPHVARVFCYSTSRLDFSSFARTMATEAAKSTEFATIDLSKYDPEQSKLMDERCIVVDENDRALGALDKKTCRPRPCHKIKANICTGHLMKNINTGLLHRAFSAFVFRPSDGALLLQQRATEKITFPDMWTNTCCSHPLDDFEEEKIEKDQLGVLCGFLANTRTLVSTRVRRSHGGI